MAEELVKLTANEAAAAIARGAISAEDYTRACLERIEAHDGEIKAFAHLDREHALAQARKLDARRLLRRVRDQADARPRLACGRAGAVGQARSYRGVCALAR